MDQNSRTRRWWEMTAAIIEQRKVEWSMFLAADQYFRPSILDFLCQKKGSSVPLMEILDLYRQSLIVNNLATETKQQSRKNKVSKTEWSLQFSLLGQDFIFGNCCQNCDFYPSRFLQIIDVSEWLYIKILISPVASRQTLYSSTSTSSLDFLADWQAELERKWERFGFSTFQFL